MLSVPMRVQLSMRNWRSVEQADLNLAPFTVMVGRNSTGKSNVVDALVFLSEAARDASTAVSRRGGIASIRRWGPSKPYDIRLEIRAASESGADQVRHELVIKSGKDGAWHFGSEVVESLKNGKVMFRVERDRNGVVMAEGPLQDFEMEPTTSVALVARTMAGPARRSRFGPPLAVRTLRPVPEVMRQPQPPTEQGRISETGVNVTSALRTLKPPDRDSVIAAMKRIVPGLTNVQAAPAGRYLTLVFTQEHGPNRRPEFAATEMSDGALRALAVIVAAHQMSRNELLVIEEPEVNLHPGAADVVYDVLHRASERGAVLLTTHSPELLERARDDEILVCEYVDGVTRVGPLSAGQRAIIRDGLFSAAELMRTEDLRREGAEPSVVRDI